MDSTACIRTADDDRVAEVGDALDEPDEKGVGQAGFISGSVTVGRSFQALARSVCAASSMLGLMPTTRA